VLQVFQTREARSRRYVDQAMRFDRCFVRIGLAFDDDTFLDRPEWALLVGPRVQDIGEQRLEPSVGLELALNLRQKLFRVRRGVRKDPDGDLGIAQDLLDRTRERDNRRLVVLARPQIKVSVRPSRLRGSGRRARVPDPTRLTSGFARWTPTTFQPAHEFRPRRIGVGRGFGPIRRIPGRDRT